MAEIKVNVELGALDTLSKLLGVFDENLNIISRETGVTAYVEGTKITLSGEENRVLLAETVINKLAGIIRSGEPIDKTRIIYCVELAKEGNAEGIEKVMSGVIAITSRGKQIKCKTVGQKKYVDAIKKNTVVFGVGPAAPAKPISPLPWRFRRSKTRKWRRLFSQGPPWKRAKNSVFCREICKPK